MSQSDDTVPAEQGKIRRIPRWGEVGPLFQDNKKLRLEDFMRKSFENFRTFRPGYGDDNIADALTRSDTAVHFRGKHKTPPCSRLADNMLLIAEDTSRSGNGPGYGDDIATTVPMETAALQLQRYGLFLQNNGFVAACARQYMSIARKVLEEEGVLAAEEGEKHRTGEE